VYPKDKIVKIAKLIKESASDIANQKAYDDIGDMYADIGIAI